jgi:sterol desaturase/sphingolipid hydroxylase (fatty acid hydroxylase superfamily)
VDTAWTRLTAWGPSWAWFIPLLFAVHAITLWGANAVFQAMHRRGVLKRFQVAEGKPPPEPLVRRMRVRAILNTLNFSAGAAAVYGALRLRGVDFSAALPGPWTVAWQLLACAVITDTSFYWMHRTLHRPWWFARVHRQHHDFRYVRALSSEDGHTVEDLGNFVCSFLGPVIVGAHPATVMLWLVVRVLETVDAHSGYALTPSASRHAYHHEFNRGNFGAFFSLWDRLLGTDADWTKWLRAAGVTPSKTR